MTQICPDDAMLKLVELVADPDQTGALAYLDQLMRDHPADARLHFVAGSLMAGRTEYAAARSAMERAVALAPDFAIARFQLGMLLLTSGETLSASAVLEPLVALPPSDSLALFANGLLHLIRGEHNEAIGCLRRGIERNADNAPLNHDMGLLLGQLEDGGATVSGSVVPSATQIMLQQAAIKSTKH